MGHPVAALFKCLPRVCLPAAETVEAAAGTAAVAAEIAAEPCIVDI